MGAKAPLSEGISSSYTFFENGYVKANYPDDQQQKLFIMASALVANLFIFSQSYSVSTLNREEIMIVYITRNIVARMRRNDGTDKGCYPLNPGKYEANKTNDGALEILQDAGEPVYLLPFIWWEKMELGDILIAA